MNYSNKTTFRILFSAVILIAVVATTVIIDWPAPSGSSQSGVPTDECGPIEPSDKDVKIVLSFGKNAFSSPDWIKSYTVEPHRVSLARHNDIEGSVEQTDLQMFNCGYSQADLDSYFSEENLGIMFASYDEHTQANFCEITKLALYEFDLTYQGSEYSARLWAKQESDTRLLTVRLVFPKSNPALLNDYSQKLFPALTSCP